MISAMAELQIDLKVKRHALQSRSENELLGMIISRVDSIRNKALYQHNYRQDLIELAAICVLAAGDPTWQR